jgi:predicted NUDIX family NTP pyrophosphohydrolase
MPEVSAGLLMYKITNGELKIFLVHPGGPYFKNKDEGFWSIPKGLIEQDEDQLQAAVREFEEETSIKPSGGYLPLGTITQKSGKIVHAWAFEKNIKEPLEIICNTIELQWPPKSGKKITIPEVDRGEYFSENLARKKINQAQVPFIDRLKKK